MLACLQGEGCLALSVYSGREEKAPCQQVSNQITITSSAISEGEKKLILPAGGQNSMLPRKMQAKLLLPLRKVSAADAL